MDAEHPTNTRTQLPKEFQRPEPWINTSDMLENDDDASVLTLPFAIVTIHSFRLINFGRVLAVRPTQVAVRVGTRVAEVRVLLESDVLPQSGKVLVPLVSSPDDAGARGISTRGTNVRQ